METNKTKKKSQHVNTYTAHVLLTLASLLVASVARTENQECGRD